MMMTMRKSIVCILLMMMMFVFMPVSNPTYGVGANDGILAYVEIAQTSSLWLGGWQVTSLKGIEYLSALSTIHCNGAQLTELDVSSNRALSYLACSNNNIMTLNIGSLPALQKIECNGNQLTGLDISGCNALETVDCSRNKLTALNAAGCVSL